MFLLGTLCLSACSSQPIDSIEQLASRGFYGYVLPTQVLIERGWRQSIYMRSFDDHCIQWDTIPQPNPIYIDYYSTTGDDTLLFSISISPVNAYWNRTRQIHVVEVAAAWTPNLQAEYYRIESESIYLKVKDFYDMDVVVYARAGLVDLDNMLELISQLEYVGASLESSTNPWEQVCAN